LIEMGVDVLNVQRECNDWSSIFRNYGGRVVLWGGISSRTLDLGTPEAIIEEVKECCHLGRNGGVVMMPGHELEYPAEKIQVMREAWREYGFYADHAEF